MTATEPDVHLGHKICKVLGEVPCTLLDKLFDRVIITTVLLGVFYGRKCRKARHYGFYLQRITRCAIIAEFFK